MRHLVLPHWHQLALHDRDVRGLQQRVSEEPVVRDVAFGQVAEALFVRGHPLQPSERGDHPEQQGELGDLRDVGLAVDRGLGRIDPRGEPVEHQATDPLRQQLGPVVVGREHVPVRDEEEGVVLVLELAHVEDVAEPVPDVERAGRPVARQDPGPARGVLGRCGGSLRVDAAMILPGPGGSRKDQQFAAPATTVHTARTRPFTMLRNGPPSKKKMASMNSTMYWSRP